MSRLVIETQGLCDWRSRLADPIKHWRREFSAFELAVQWEMAGSERKNESGMPQEINRLLDGLVSQAVPRKMLVGIVEHKVQLEHGVTASQNDMWAIVRVGDDLLSLAIEGKAGEGFDELVADWLKDGSRGPNGEEDKKRTSKKPQRLASLQDILGIAGADVGHLRYQLLHRTASALIEAERIGAKYAAMIIQSFKNPKRNADGMAHFDDFQRFGAALGVTVEAGRLSPMIDRKGIGLCLGWASCELATDATIAALA